MTPAVVTVVKPTSRQVAHTVLPSCFLSHSGLEVLNRAENHRRTAQSFCSKNPVTLDKPKSGRLLCDHRARGYLHHITAYITDPQS